MKREAEERQWRSRRTRVLERGLRGCIWIFLICSTRGWLTNLIYYPLPPLTNPRKLHTHSHHRAICSSTRPYILAVCFSLLLAAATLSAWVLLSPSAIPPPVNTHTHRPLLEHPGRSLITLSKPSGRKLWNLKFTTRTARKFRTAALRLMRWGSIPAARYRPK